MRSKLASVSLAEATKSLEPFVLAGVLAHADVHVAAAIARLVPKSDPAVVLAAAMAVRVTRLGHVCLLLDDPAASIADADADAGIDADAGDEPIDLRDLPWPDPASWVAALEASPAVIEAEAIRRGAAPSPMPPLVLDGGLLYLERYWRFETAVSDDLLSRASGSLDDADTDSAGVIDRLFPADDQFTDDRQRAVVEKALRHRLVVVGGGPGTGKTTTIAKLLAAIDEIARRHGSRRMPEIALAAPTGKAAARMTEAIHHAATRTEGLGDASRAALSELQAVTIHRLLGSTGGLRFRHDASSPITADVVVIDEASMISLPLMARLLAAVRPTARLVLLGDANQLASIEAGAVLGDIVAGAAAAKVGGEPGRLSLAGRIVQLDRVFRVDAEAVSITQLAAAINHGDVAAVLKRLDADDGIVRWIRPDDDTALSRLDDELAANGAEVVRAALKGHADEALRKLLDVKVLAATRRGAFGVDEWCQRLERLVGARVPELRSSARWYVGRPVLVTANDRINRLNNGDTGIVIADGSVAIGSPGADIRFLQPSQVASCETWWSMTIHKSQGSEFAHTVVSLPTATSPILTRELLYTAVTRARSRVTVIASQQVLTDAVERPLTRASGLAQRLAGG